MPKARRLSRSFTRLRRSSAMRPRQRVAPQRWFLCLRTCSTRRLPPARRRPSRASLSAVIQKGVGWRSRSMVEQAACSEPKTQRLITPLSRRVTDPARCASRSSRSRFDSEDVGAVRSADRPAPLAGGGGHRDRTAGGRALAPRHQALRVQARLLRSVLGHRSDLRSRVPSASCILCSNFGDAIDRARTVPARANLGAVLHVVRRSSLVLVALLHRASLRVT